MGFGSYDESEQDSQDVSTEDDEAVSVEGSAHGGSVAFESDASTDELLDRLQEIKADADED